MLDSRLDPIAPCDHPGCDCDGYCVRQTQQQDRERLMRERGKARAMAAQRRALERGEAADTPAGVTLAKRAVRPLTDAIHAFLAPRKGAGRRHTAAKLLAGIDPELVAYITVRSVLGAAAVGQRVHKAALALTEALEEELIADAFERDHGALYRAVVRNARERGLAPARQAKAVGLANRQFALVERPWTFNQRTHLGVKLVELAVSTLGILEAYFEKRRKGKKIRQSHRLRFTPEIDAWMAKYNAAASLTKPLYLPTVVPPKPWEGVRGGGYYSGRPLQLIAKPFPGQMEALQAATEAGTMAPVYKGLNGLQNTAWRVNKRVLEVMREAWDGNVAGLPMPKREPEPKPEAPREVVEDVKGGAHRRAWRRMMRGWHERDTKDRAARFEFVRALGIAEEHAEFPEIYFPHRLDFRSRAYAVGTTMHPQGPDECRALLEFAEGKALGERGVFWLGVHGANLFGNDKVSLEERYAWARGYEHMIVECAHDPLRNRWWTEADKPWSFLAWCFEWAGSRKHFMPGASEPSPTRYLSHMPIALDGTCNGLQHYAAMLRDEVGGKAVNLVPGDKPNDGYQDVAALVTEKLLVDAAAEGPTSWMSDRLLHEASGDGPAVRGHLQGSICPESRMKGWLPLNGERVHVSDGGTRVAFGVTPTCQVRSG
jgi:Autographiviridae RNA polymerase